RRRGALGYTAATHFLHPIPPTRYLPMNDDDDVKMSPLSQRFEQDGKVVYIEIYDDGEGGWLLEVVDEDNNSTMWEDAFDSDEDALAEALAAIAEHGIDTLIGPA